MELIHKINQLESVVSSVAKHLNEPNLIQDLKEKESNKKFWATVDLQALVRSRMKQAYEDMKVPDKWFNMIILILYIQLICFNIKP